MPTQKKIDLVTDLSSKLQAAKALVFTDYRGLTHKQLEDLRRHLKKLGAHFVIAKNTLLFRALNAFLATDIEGIKKDLVGPTATLIATQDEVLPLKELTKLIKTTKLPVIKFGFLGKTKLNQDDVVRLSTLPTREVLLGQFVAGLIAPVYGLHHALTWNMRKLVYALDAIKEKKEIMSHEA